MIKEDNDKYSDNEDEEEGLWSTEAWYKTMMYYLKTEMFMFTGEL